MTKDPAIRDRFIELRAEGHTLIKIAEMLDISRRTAVNWEKEYKERIKAAHAFRIEELQDKYMISKQKKIELFGDRLIALKNELARRDLSEVPTHKIFDMIIKCIKVLEKEAEKPVFGTEEDIDRAKTRRLYWDEFLKNHPPK